MPIIKKLIFAPVFLLILAVTCFYLSPLFRSYDLLFSLNRDTFIQVLTICMLFLTSGLFFTLFITLSQDWKFIAPVILISAITPLVSMPQPQSWVMAAGIIAICVFTLLSLNNKLKSYLTFQPTALLIPSIKTFASLLALVASFGFYLSASSQIKQTGFTIPDSIIDVAIKAIPQPDIPGLEQTVKATVKSQLDQIIKPYVGFIPVLLAVSFFLTLNWIVSILGLILSPLIWVIFEILTKTGFAQLTTEMREVKKLVI